jgi:hypothetical protein
MILPVLTEDVPSIGVVVAVVVVVVVVAGVVFETIFVVTGEEAEGNQTKTHNV